MNPLNHFMTDDYSKNLSEHATITIANDIVKAIRPYATNITIAGSIRRGVAPRDIDIVLIPKNKIGIHHAIIKLGGKIWSEGQSQIYFKIKGVDVNIYYADAEHYGAQLMTRTGPRGGNIGNRTLAKNKGLILNQYGLYKGNKLIAAKTEREIYEGLGKKYKPPEQRGRK